MQEESLPVQIIVIDILIYGGFHPVTAVLEFRSYSATDWPTVKLLHDLQIFF